MIKVWYFNLLHLKQNVFEEHLFTLPSILTEEIVSYLLFEDKAARLIGKLLIRKAIIETGYQPELLSIWQKDKNEKPFINNWLPFNISHSKDYVVIAFGGNMPIGIDIENKRIIVMADSLSDYFCPEEQELIKNSIQPEKIFFNLWVKKEAMSKAIGKGIANGLNLFDCRKNFVDYDKQKWVLKKLDINDKYVCYLAISNEKLPIKVREIFIDDLA